MISSIVKSRKFNEHKVNATPAQSPKKFSFLPHAMIDHKPFGCMRALSATANQMLIVSLLRDCPYIFGKISGKSPFAPLPQKQDIRHFFFLYQHKDSNGAIVDAMQSQLVQKRCAVPVFRGNVHRMRPRITCFYIAQYLYSAHF